MTVWIPLRGGDGEDRKKPQHGQDGWQLRDYVGGNEATDPNLGLRLDDYIVVDCDCAEAAEAWLRHIGVDADMAYEHTYVRKTPKGWHFFYRRNTANLRVQAHKPTYVHDKIDLKLGMGHYVVFHMEGYRDLSPAAKIIAFDPAWVKDTRSAVVADEWSEMPDGMGDNAMIAFAGTFRRWGMDQATIQRCLTEINAITMTKKPMLPGAIRRLARSANRYDPDEQRQVLCPQCGNEVTIV